MARLDQGVTSIVLTTNEFKKTLVEGPNNGHQAPVVFIGGDEGEPELRRHAEDAVRDRRRVATIWSFANHVHLSTLYQSHLRLDSAFYKKYLEKSGFGLKIWLPADNRPTSFDARHRIRPVANHSLHDWCRANLAEEDLPNRTIVLTTNEFREHLLAKEEVLPGHVYAPYEI